MDVGAVTVSRVRSLNHQFSPDFNEIDFENDFDAVWDWYDKRNQKLTLSRIKVVYQKYDNHEFMKQFNPNPFHACDLRLCIFVTKYTIISKTIRFVITLLHKNPTTTSLSHHYFVSTLFLLRNHQSRVQCCVVVSCTSSLVPEYRDHTTLSMFCTRTVYYMCHIYISNVQIQRALAKNSRRSEG